mmetsp:Transcript_10392/g.27703  ORF Transcript_10392/g.27703 Transcript_10392/m.27703 type:complete len:294 (+) Transcript_10392:1169-2050(+)
MHDLARAMEVGERREQALHDVQGSSLAQGVARDEAHEVAAGAALERDGPAGLDRRVLRAEMAEAVEPHHVRVRLRLREEDDLASDGQVHLKLAGGVLDPRHLRHHAGVYASIFGAHQPVGVRARARALARRLPIELKPAAEVLPDSAGGPQGGHRALGHLLLPGDHFDQPRRPLRAPPGHRQRRGRGAWTGRGAAGAPRIAHGLASTELSGVVRTYREAAWNIDCNHPGAVRGARAALHLRPQERDRSHGALVLVEHLEHRPCNSQEASLLSRRAARTGVVGAGNDAGGKSSR